MCAKPSGKRGIPYADLGLDDPSPADDRLLGAMEGNPILINRPLVETPRGTRLCRPSEVIPELLDHPVRDFTKENGERVAHPPAG